MGERIAHASDRECGFQRLFHGLLSVETDGLVRDFLALSNREELGALPDCPISEAQWERALWVYEQLSDRGGALQRAVKYPDLLIAAAAEAADVSLLHYDDNYDLIADITGQPMRWLARKDSLR